MQKCLQDWATFHRSRARQTVLTFLHSLWWRPNGRDSDSNHQPHDCLLSRLFRRRSRKTPKLRVTGICAGNPPGTGVFPAQMASDAENVLIWWRHHGDWIVSKLCFAKITIFHTYKVTTETSTGDVLIVITDGIWMYTSDKDVAVNNA